MTAKPGTVYFIGAGPGAPDLITVRGRDLIAQADLILYADSLVSESVAQLAHKPNARQIGTSGMHLDEFMHLMRDTVQNGGIVARVHSGDPALYGATHEQMVRLEEAGIPYEIVPGVTAAFAAAALLRTELTVPETVQTIILTRAEGRTPMPPGENLRHLAATGASLAIYLSVTRIKQVIADLLGSGGYTPETPVAVLHKVTWPDESYVTGTLADIADKVRAAGYTRQALILVSPALESRLRDGSLQSNLYASHYTHRFRRAEQKVQTQQITQSEHPVTSIIAMTRRGSALALQLGAALETTPLIPAKFASENATPYDDSVLRVIRQHWAVADRLVLVMPTGVAVRAIAPLLHHKKTDPAVVCLDEQGQSVIPLLGGHQAGANALARQIADLTGGYAAITTASDGQGKPALDLPPDGWHINPRSAVTHAAASLVNDESVAVYLDPALTHLQPEVEAWLTGIERVSSLDDLAAYHAGLIITHRAVEDAALLTKSIIYHPPVLVVGMGCQRHVPAEELRAALDTSLAEAGLALGSVITLATVDLKADEIGLKDLALDLRIPMTIVESAQVRTAFAGHAHLSPSAAQTKLDLPGVAEPCALWVAMTDTPAALVVPKRSFARCTVAVALKGGV